MLMELSEEEIRLIANYRHGKQQAAELREKRANCNHDWEWYGRGGHHNEDWYRCTLCGETKDE